MNIALLSGAAPCRCAHVALAAQYLPVCEKPVEPGVAAPGAGVEDGGLQQQKGSNLPTGMSPEQGAPTPGAASVGVAKSPPPMASQSGNPSEMDEPLNSTKLPATPL